MDAVKNFVLGFLAEGYDDEAFVFDVRAEDAARFPDPGVVGEYDVTVYNCSSYQDAALDPHVEIVRVIAKSGAALTLKNNGSVREPQQNTSASNKNLPGRTYCIAMNWTAKNVDDLVTEINTKADQTYVDSELSDLETAFNTALGNYYTKTAMDALLANKSDVGHNHDGRYYTITAMDTLLAAKQNTIGYVPVNQAGDTMTGPLIIGLAALATTQTDGVSLINQTNATIGVPVQVSPSTKWRTNGLETTGNTSQTFEYRADVLAISQSGYIDAEWRLRSSLNSAAYVDRFGVRSSGNDTYLRVGGVNFFVKAGNSNGYLAGSTNLRFYSNNGSAVYATMDNSDGTWIYTTNPITGTSTKPVFDISGIWNGTGVSDGAFRVNMTQTATGTNSKLVNFKVNNSSRFAVWVNTGGSETYIAVNDSKVFGQGSGAAQFYAASKFRFYDQGGGNCYAQMDATGFWSIGDAGAGSLTIPQAAPYRMMIYGNASAVSHLVFSAHSNPKPYYETRSSRGSIGAPTATQSGDVIGGLLMGGYGASQWNTQGAAIVAYATENFSNSAGGSAIKFETTANTTVTRTVRAIISNGGNFVIGAAETTSYAALRSATAVLEAILADGSDYAAFKAASLATKQPSAGGAGVWKLGKKIAGVTAHDAANYVEVDVDGAVLKLALAV